MDYANNMAASVGVNDDFTWAYTWNWTFNSDQSASGLYEYILLNDEQGSEYDGARESSHDADPGQIFAGGNNVSRRLRNGNNTWIFRVYTSDGSILGETMGNIIVNIPTD